MAQQPAILSPAQNMSKSSPSSDSHMLSLLTPVPRERYPLTIFRPKLNEGLEWGSITYKEFEDNFASSQRHWTHTLGTLGLAFGDVVGLWLTGRRYEDLINILGVSAAGYVPQVFSLVFSNHDVVWDLLSASSAKALIIDAMFTDQAKAAPVATLFTLTRTDLERIPGAKTDGQTLPTVTDTQTAVIFHSSGTTSGSPKLIPVTHSWIKFFITRKYSLNEGQFEGQNVVNTLGSLAHVGSFCAFIGAVYHGFCTVQGSSMALPTDELMAMIKKCGVNRVILYAPFLSVHIHAAQMDPKVLEALKGCRQIVHTGVALNPEDEEWAYNNSLRLMATYGTTETAPLLRSTIGNHPSDRFLKPIPGASGELIPHTSHEDGSAKLFEMIMRHGAPDSPHPSLFQADGLYHTGDLFEEVQAGLYAFRGRSGDWLKTLGGLCDTKSYEDNIRKTCSDLVHDVVILGSNRPFTCMFVEVLDSDLNRDDCMKLAKEIIRRNAPYAGRLFSYERVDEPSRVYVTKKGSLPRTKEKGNIRRNAAEQEFYQVLDDIYEGRDAYR